MNGVSVKAYSLERDGSKFLSEHFRVREFACKDGSDPIFIAPSLVETLQKVRDHFGKPVTITSAFRTQKHNEAVGGTKYSQHLYGTAADIKVSGVAPNTVATYVEKLLGNSGGVGRYSSFTHVDVRKQKSRWRG